MYYLRVFLCIANTRENGSKGNLTHLAKISTHRKCLVVRRNLSLMEKKLTVRRARSERSYVQR